MDEILKMLNNDIFFKGKQFTLTSIQNYNRNDKFLVEMDGRKYTVILGKEKVEKYQKRLNTFGSYFKEIIGFQYMNSSSTILVIQYFGNGLGKTLSQCTCSYDTNVKIATELKKILDDIHSHKKEFKNVSKSIECSTWYEFIYGYMKRYADYALEQNALSLDDYNFIFHLLSENKTYFDTVSLNYLHGDINEDNVCYNENTKEVYLIDFDDFLIGDTLYEYARMFQYKKIPSFEIIKEKYYPEIEKNTIFELYILRNYLMGYCFEIYNGLPSENSLKEIENHLQILRQLKK